MNSRTIADAKKASAAAGVAFPGPSKPCRKRDTKPMQMQIDSILLSAICEVTSCLTEAMSRISEISQKTPKKPYARGLVDEPSKILMMAAAIHAMRTSGMESLVTDP